MRRRRQLRGSDGNLAETIGQFLGLTLRSSPVAVSGGRAPPALRGPARLRVTDRLTIVVEDGLPPLQKDDPALSLLEALRDTWRQRRATMDELWRAAAVCRVQTVMKPYIESLT